MRKLLPLMVLLCACADKTTAPPVKNATAVEASIDTLLIKVNWLLVDCKKLGVRCTIVSVQLADSEPQHLWRAP